MPILDRLGYEARVADLGPVRVGDLFDDRRELIVRVPQLSDAYHLNLGTTDVMVTHPCRSLESEDT